MHVVLSHAEQAVWRNIERKERQAERMRQSLMEHVREFEDRELHSSKENGSCTTAEATGGGWTLKLGDSCELLKQIADSTIGLSIFSPPFLSLYSYSPTERDLGNSRSREEFWEHFRFIIDDLLRVTMPGRNCCVDRKSVV